LFNLLALAVDIVLTSYTMLHDASIKAQRWLRVVLDESQMLRSPTSKPTNTCAALFATYKWCVTGAPIQFLDFVLPPFKLIAGTPVGTGLNDLLGCFRFLNVQPICNDTWWKGNVTKTFVTALGANYLMVCRSFYFLDDF
jgi:DNA repair protein RAD5